MKKIFIIIFLLPAILAAQNINGRLSSSIYTFERNSDSSHSQTNVRGYQTAVLNINQGQFSLRTRLSLDANYSNTLDNDPRLRFYNLYLEGRNLFNMATIKIGRQSLYNAVGVGVFDGASLKLKYSNYSLSGFYGGNVPAYQKLELTNDWSNDYVLGGKLEGEPINNLRFGLGFVDKNFKSASYWANRLDENLNPVQIEIQKRSNQFTFATAELGYEVENFFTVFSKAEYDLNFETISKVELTGRYNKIENLGIDFYYNFREPRIRYNSIFSVFNFGTTQEIEAGVDYKVNEKLTVIGKFGNVYYSDETSQRITLGVNTNAGNISYRKSFGYAGELDALSLYFAKSFMEGVLTPSAGLSFTSYKISPDDSRSSLVSLLVGTNVRPWKTISFDVQGQYFHSKIYQNDFRFLFKVNYWFNSNLNLI
jgi:hypothetical protein